jgi:hypothetical protein
MLVLIYFFSFKCILVILLYFFFKFGQILNCLSTNMVIKKNYYKNTKMPIDANFNFFFLSIYFGRFTVILKYKKIYLSSVNLVVTNKPYKKILILLINNFKFFFYENDKIMKTLFQYTIFLLKCYSVIFSLLYAFIIEAFIYKYITLI